MNMKKLILVVIALSALLPSVRAVSPDGSLPLEIYAEGGRHHVQGIACDREAGRMYFSFTTTFVKTDLQGKVIGTVEHIQGHLGAMVFNKADRKVYASLECKDDVIGAGLSDFAKGRSMFYIAIIDVDRIDSVGMDSEDNDAFRIVCVKEATTDYHVTGFGPRGEEFEHLYGCSGIDGVAIAPKIGRKRGRDFLYVAYGIYGDKARPDNDCQVLLRYDIQELNKYSGKVRFGEFYDKGPSKPAEKYFIYTGNTNWGVQNMAYDPSSGKLFLFVYKGSKAMFRNYDAFVLDISDKAPKRPVPGVPYDTSLHPLAGSPAKPVGGIEFRYGSTGVSPLGDGTFYISENGRTESGNQYCRARLYRWDGDNFRPCN